MWPVAKHYFKKYLLPLKISHNHKFSQGNNTYTRGERCSVDPYYKIHPDPMLSSILVPLFSIIDTKHNKKKHHTTTVILSLPPHPIFNKFVIPLFKSNTKTRTGTNGSKNKFRIYMIYFHSWGLLLNCRYNRITTVLYK